MIEQTSLQLKKVLKKKQPAKLQVQSYFYLDFLIYVFNLFLIEHF